MRASSQWHKPSFSKVSDWLKVFVNGMCMGAADVVPGISGGTVAFIIGIYEDLLYSIATLNKKNFFTLFKGNFREFFNKVSWEFLLSLLCGMATSFLLLAKCILFLLNDEVYRVYLYSLFLGLVLGSCVFCLRQFAIWNMRVITCICIGALTAFILTRSDIVTKSQQALFDVPLLQKRIPQVAIEKIKELRPYNVDEVNSLLLQVPVSQVEVMALHRFIDLDTKIYDHATSQLVTVSEVVSQQDSPLLDMWVIVCGMIAVSAMLLPGISGSYMLTILGVYAVILGALIDWIDGIVHLTFHAAAFRIIMSMGIGIIIGAIIFSRAVTYCLQRYRDMTLALLVGFMIGALRSVWPFWNCRYMIMPGRLHDGPVLEAMSPIIPDCTTALFSIALCITLFGFSLVLLIEYAGRKNQDT